MASTATHHRAPRVDTLDLLRLFAALAVVAYHFCFRGAAGGTTAIALPALEDVTKYSYLGVELFFVISGFVIAYSAEGRTARQFLVARAARIYPAFLVCMTLTFVVTLAFGPPHFETSLFQWVANLFIAAPALGEPFMDGVYWSIVYELTFYAWVLALIVLGFFSKYLTQVVMAWLAISAANEILIDSALLRSVFITDDSGFFCAGLLLYLLHSGRRDDATWPLLGIATFIGAAQSMLKAEWLRDHFTVSFSGPVIGGLSIAIVALVGIALLPKRVPLPASVLLAIGGLTYPLYLLHQHIGFIAFNRLDGLASPAVIIIGVTLALIGLSLLIWRYVERPGQRLMKALLLRATGWIDRLPQRRPQWEG
ncbi:MAG: acyltransferase [Bauldia sp.]|nr:acyltransferase [Bauldia sp.]